MPPIANRMARLGTESAFEVLAKARALEAQGRRIVHLEIGEPDFETAPHVKQAAAEALEAGYTHYGPSPGLMPAREAVARYVSRTRGIPVDPEHVVITPGGKPILAYTILATVGEGDEVLVPDPGFPIYGSMVEYVGGRVIPVPLLESREFRFDPDELRRRVTDRTRLIILNSPQNPTGGVLAPADLEAVAAIARERDLWVLSDEIYSRLLYDGEHHSIASLPEMAERTVILDGFSKTYAMTGWRLGYGVAPAALVPHLSRLQTNITSCTASFVQMAGIAALEGTQQSVEDMLTEFIRRRSAVVAGLNAIDGVRCLLPGGAFYAFPHVDVPGMNSKQIADFLLDEEGVALLAGTAFGPQGEGFLRLSFATSMEELTEGIDRIRRGLIRLRQ
ncbi:MAG TPA: pyridoxal phosphate-dependent aminotransferase [Chloroflexota bacterium]|nr:pyridoxal phosphate-dependent aminotransferase [Chloroflexota bacterium]